MDIATVGIAGSGAMGRGIAQIAAEGGYQVLLYDARDGAAKDAWQFASKMIARKAEKGQLSAAESAASQARLSVVDELEGFAPAQVVVEAVTEDMAVKQDLFRKLETVVGQDALLATNTSSLSVTAVAAACQRPERVAGFHFFNPVPLMKVVEVVPGLRTAPETCATLEALAKSMGHRPVVAADTPGFLVNHAGRGYKTEAFRAYDDCVADHFTIDRILRDGLGFRMGPFELADLIGLDVSLTVMEQVYRQFYDEPRFKPIARARTRVSAGLLGRKTGEGFYRYDDGRLVDPELPNYAPCALGPVLVGHSEIEEARTALIERLDAAGLDAVANPEDASLHIVLPFGSDCTGEALENGFPPEDTVAVDPCMTLDGEPMVGRLAVIMTNPATRPGLAEGLAAALGGPENAVVINDSSGFVAQRVVANIINTACGIAQRGIAKPGDIDVAVRLGLGYPVGPLEMGDLMGPRRILRLLEWLAATTGEPRYRASLWLRRRALLGLPLAG